MVKYSSTRLDSIFQALSHPVRRNILTSLLEKEHTVSELAQPYNISLPAITKHLHILENSKLIVRKKQGRTYILRINTKPLLGIKEWLIVYEILWTKLLQSAEI